MKSDDVGGEKSTELCTRSTEEKVMPQHTAGMAFHHMAFRGNVRRYDTVKLLLRNLLSVPSRYRTTNFLSRDHQGKAR